MSSALENINTSDIAETKYNKCAPNVKFSNGSCIDLNILVKMAKVYNKQNPTSAIVLDDNRQIMNPDEYKKYLLKQFKTIFKNCNDQKCWTKQKFMQDMDIKIRKQLEKNTFRPLGPAQGNKWLNTTNIDEAMQQYEEEYKDFFYLGTVPIDFDKVGYRNFKTGFDKYIEKEKYKLGAVFNLDNSRQSGSHWVSMFIDLGKGEVYFSDSYGMSPEKEIAEYMHKAGDFIVNKLNKKLVVKINKTRHQRGGSECGVYSMDFILRLLKGQKFDDIVAKRIPDEVVNKRRNEFFIDENKLMKRN